MVKTKSIKTSFIGSHGNQLDARLDLPEGKPKAFVIFSHCFTCTKEIITVHRSSRALARSGYAVLRFDFSGLGNSEGDFSESNFSTTIEDLNAAIEFLTENYTAPSILIGHSLGGTSSLAAAINQHSIKKIITIASPSQPAHVLHHFGHALTMLEQNIASSFEVAGQFYDIGPQFVEDVRDWDMQSQLSKLRKPVLIFKIENDELVSEKNADEIQQWVEGETTLITLRNTDHLLSNKESNADAVNKMVDWLEKPD
jgi:putative redox protein